MQSVRSEFGMFVVGKCGCMCLCDDRPDKQERADKIEINSRLIASMIKTLKLRS